MEIAVEQDLVCYHCGDTCNDDRISIEDKLFCCEGCKTVYEILDSNNLCNYYQIAPHAGKAPQKSHFEFLDNPQIASQLIDFKNDNFERITFFIPSIHCISCLYLLENLYKIHPAIKSSRVDFLKKQVTIDYSPLTETSDRPEGGIYNKEKANQIPIIEGINLRQVAELLTSLGYEPLISLNDVVKEKQTPIYRKLLTKIGVAGFCVGNIMLYSFPEYLGLADIEYKHLFGILNFLFALPVVFYAGFGYFDSVYRSLKKGIINIDVPILLGILVAFFRSVYEVFVLNGAGYFDSLTGLIFFLLVGKWFQQKTHDYLSFERDYKSYFPLAATRLVRGVEESIPVGSLKKGDKVLIRNQELIPADGIVYKGSAQIDYSFVTGESQPEQKKLGDLIYAGGKQIGESIELEVLKEVSQSYLTQLWNNEAFQKNHTSPIKSFADKVGKYFTIIILIIATLAGFFWWNLYDTARALNAFTAILIIACPCALSLSYPFALGNGLRILGKHHFYLKNANVIELLAKVDTIVFDKTGTLTNTIFQETHFVGKRKLMLCEQIAIKSLVQHTFHPIAIGIKDYFKNINTIELSGWKEVTGSGLSGSFNGHLLKIGSAQFVGISYRGDSDHLSGSMAHVEIDDEYIGYFEVKNNFRNGIEKTIEALENNYELFVLSGDNEADKTSLKNWFSVNHIHFNCKPQDKLNFIKNLQAEGKKVLMLGDGLNDAGALKQADVGIAVTENTTQFTPSSDAILEANFLQKLPQFLNYSKFSLQLIHFSFAVSLIYNFIGLSYAISGQLSPVIAAILMPISSITMLLIATLGMVYRGKQLV